MKQFEDVQILQEQERTDAHDAKDDRTDVEMKVRQDVVIPGFVKVDKIPDGQDRAEHYDGRSDQLAANDAALELFVKPAHLLVDLMSGNCSLLAIFDLHLHILVNIEIHHRRVDQIQKAGRDEDTEETVEPDWSIVTFLKAREGSFLPLNALHSL